MGYLCQQFDDANNAFINAAVRVSQIDVLNEPLLVHEDNGAFLVHENTGINWSKLLTLQPDNDEVSLYDQKELTEEYPDKNFYTLEQYKEDQAVLDHGRMSINRTMMGVIEEQTGVKIEAEVLRSQMLYMRDRIEEVGNDMDERGFTHQPNLSGKCDLSM